MSVDGYALSAAKPLDAVEILQVILEASKMNTVRTCEPSMDRQIARGQVNVPLRSQATIFRFAHCSVTRHLEPEKRPLLAMLEENVDCFQRYLKARDEGGKVLFQDAAEWIFEDGGDWKFSFESVCSQLGLNPVSLREKLLQWKTAALKGALPCQVLSLSRSR
jgi:hypothetical protein